MLRVWLYITLLTADWRSDKS